MSRYPLPVAVPPAGAVRRSGWRWWLSRPCTACGKPFWSYLALRCLCFPCWRAAFAARAVRRLLRRGSPLALRAALRFQRTGAPS